MTSRMIHTNEFHASYLGKVTKKISYGKAGGKRRHEGKSVY